MNGTGVKFFCPHLERWEKMQRLYTNGKYPYEGDLKNESSFNMYAHMNILVWTCTAEKIVGHRDPITECVGPMECVLVSLRKINLSTWPSEVLVIELDC